MSFVGGTLKTHADARPGGTAIAFETVNTTWSALYEHVEHLAASIHAETPKGMTVALDLVDPLDLGVAFLAVARSGHTAVLCDPSWSKRQRAHILETLKPAVHVTSDYVRNVLDNDDVQPSPPIPANENPLMIGFTSGSTGTPKGYERTHGSWLASVRSAQAEFSIGPADQVCLPGSLNFSLFLYAFVHAIECGAGVRLFNKFAPKTVARAMHKDRTTVLFTVPTQARMIINALSGIEDDGLSSLRLILSSGAKWGHTLSDRDRAAIPAATILEFYGASELSFVSFVHISDDQAPGCVGHPFPGVEIQIRDDSGAPLGTDIPGTIWVKSEMQFTRYAMGAGLECQRDGDFMTVGDRGFVDEDGRLHLSGRETRMLVSAGENIYPEVVEMLLKAHPGIADAAVIGVGDNLRGQRIVAAVQFDDSEDRPMSSDLIRMCEDELGTRALPRRFYILEDWPLAASGKTDFDRIADILESDDVEQLD